MTEPPPPCLAENIFFSHTIPIWYESLLSIEIKIFLVTEYDFSPSFVVPDDDCVYKLDKFFLLIADEWKGRSNIVKF